MNPKILSSIDKASKVIGKTWPLHTFVASNPLSGYENSSFFEAVKTAKKHFDATVFPEAKMYREAWEKGEIDNNLLKGLLHEEGLTNSPEEYLKDIEIQSQQEALNANHDVDRIMAKWLAAFMDEGLAEWNMPFKSEGFYNAWRLLVIYDEETGLKSLKNIPPTSLDALESILRDFPETEYTNILTYHLAALPGWTGYINHRQESNSEWQQKYPITLSDYLAARLLTAKSLGISLVPEVKSSLENELIIKLQYILLKAWEQSWQNRLVNTLENQSVLLKTVENDSSPDAQLVFCIDTRSELIRRHVESSGNYETYGYAGFFGIAMDYESLDDGIVRKSCPPIVGSAYKVTEKAQINGKNKLEKYNAKNDIAKFSKYFLKRMKNMLPSAFGYVEGSGLYYGISLIARTLFPRRLYQQQKKKSYETTSFCEPDINPYNSSKACEISLDEKVGIVKSGFDLMGWKTFSPLVLFVGHGSHSANNPFGSSLDCGACAASPGRHNARTLAKLANEPEVRKALTEIHGFQIPEVTLFLGAEHNTTTDEIVLFDSEIPESHSVLVARLKKNLGKAQRSATADRLGTSTKSIVTAEKKASNWAETRPEWGLAKNAGFIVGPRSLTQNTNLDSRCFLHSYNWELDTTGKALEGIMQGPMVVTQWINNHYYFSTVDNNTFGGGSKITHNITGRFGVVQGNGGDLKMGLPLQSLFDSDDRLYHKPLRLSVMIQAPINRVSDILLRNENLKTLLDNEWIYLMVMDPKQNNGIFRYKKSIQWELMSDAKTVEFNQQVNIKEKVLEEISA
ncbi:DUF2309 domain-containing protein [Aquimarina rubra]|uniref:Probable inorganic carbon transporter subunit DabA n=1 Tax=Aquimarina rubra TaxID=1920033 RepID=A0ABW5LCS7_9FLAO